MIDATAIFLKAQQAWLARVVPPYESFRVACEHTFLTARCNDGDLVVFTVRSSDGRTAAFDLPANGAPPKLLMRGGFITGPADAPLGFYRVVPNGLPPPPAPPPNLAPDPFSTIATVTADSHVYNITYGGEEIVANRRCYHLYLRPRFRPDRYPLRDLWVDETSSEVVQLNYARPYDEGRTWASVRYGFAPVGPAHAWTVVRIEAEAVVEKLFSMRTESVADDLSDISFPMSVPAWYFEPEPDT
jgi:hypothetical protein